AAVEDAATGKSTEIVDDVEWASGCVQGGGDRAGEGGRQPSEALDHEEQGANEEKAEQHVEQKCPVRPLRAVGPGAEPRPGWPRRSEYGSRPRPAPDRRRCRVCPSLFQRRAAQPAARRPTLSRLWASLHRVRIPAC